MSQTYADAYADWQQHPHAWWEQAAARAPRVGPVQGGGRPLPPLNSAADPLRDGCRLGCSCS